MQDIIQMYELGLLSDYELMQLCFVHNYSHSVIDDSYTAITYTDEEFNTESNLHKTKKSATAHLASNVLSYFTY